MFNPSRSQSKPQTLTNPPFSDSGEACELNRFFTGSTIDASSYKWVGCADGKARDFFNIRPRVATTSSTRSSSSSSSSLSSSLSSFPATTTTESDTFQAAATGSSPLSPTPSQTDTSSQNSDGRVKTKKKKKKKKSNAWIAGVVIGPLALIAVLLVALFLLRRHKNKKKADRTNIRYEAAPTMSTVPAGYPSPNAYASPAAFTPQTAYASPNAYAAPAPYGSPPPTEYYAAKHEAGAVQQQPAIPMSPQEMPGNPPAQWPIPPQHQQQPIHGQQTISELPELVAARK